MAERARTTARLAAAAAAFLLLAASPPQEGPPKQDPPKELVGLHIRTAGLGYLPAVEVPNLPLLPTDPESKRYVTRNDTWTPLSITFDHHGDALSGVLTARSVWPEDPNPMVYRRRIRIAARALSRVTMTVLNNSVWPFRISFEDDRLGTQTIAGVREFEIGRPRTLGVNQKMVLVATASRAPFTHFLRRGTQNQMLADRIVVPIEPAAIPSSSLDLQCADVLVLDDIAMESLSEPQQAAIHEWVCRGGTLVACLLRSRAGGTVLGDLLPVASTEMTNVATVADLENATGLACRLDPPTAMNVLQPRPGATAWGSPALVVHGRRDAGLVIVCGFPISSRFLQTWPGSPRLMELLSEHEGRATTSLPGTGLNDLRRKIAPALKGSIAKTVPPFLTVLVIIAIYGGAVILVPYLGLKPFKRLEYAWAVVFVLALAGSGVVYGVGTKYLKSNSSVYRVTLVEGGAASGPHTRHNFWCAFTATSDRIDLKFDRPSVPHPLGTELALRGASKTADPMQAWVDDDVHVRELRTYAQDSVLWETTDTTAVTGSLRFRAEPSASSMKAALEARDGFALGRAWVAWGAKVAEVKPGTTTLAWVEPGIPAVGGTLVMQRSFEALAAEAMRSSRQQGRPVLLYETHGTAGLEKPALAEEHLHFGMLVSEEVAAPVTRDEWGGEWLSRRLTPKPTADEVDPNEPVEFILSLAVGPSDVVEQLKIDRVREPEIGVQLYSRAKQAWEPVLLGGSFPAAPYVVQGPLGKAFVRGRLVGRNAWSSWDFPAVTSRQGRKP
jgi:hypothetical protein